MTPTPAIPQQSTPLELAGTVQSTIDWEKDDGRMGRDGVNELKAEMDRQFDGVVRQFDGVARQFEAVDRRFEEMLVLIATEGEKTRRHFDVVIEQIKGERNLALDEAAAADERTGRVTAANAADHVAFASRLDDHELRLTRLERKENS